MPYIRRSRDSTRTLEPIEEIEEGDRVLAYDEVTGESFSRKSIPANTTLTAEKQVRISNAQKRAR